MNVVHAVHSSTSVSGRSIGPDPAVGPSAGGRLALPSAQAQRAADHERQPARVEHLAPARSERREPVGGRRQVAVQVCPAIRGRGVAEPSVQLDERAEEGVADIAEQGRRLDARPGRGPARAPAAARWAARGRARRHAGTCARVATEPLTPRRPAPHAAVRDVADLAAARAPRSAVLAWCAHPGRRPPAPRPPRPRTGPARPRRWPRARSAVVADSRRAARLRRSRDAAMWRSRASCAGDAARGGGRAPASRTAAPGAPGRGQPLRALPRRQPRRAPSRGTAGVLPTRVEPGSAARCA